MRRLWLTLLCLLLLVPGASLAGEVLDFRLQFGGDGIDTAYDATVLPDGSLVVAGCTQSSAGSGHVQTRAVDPADSAAFSDAWAFRADADGNVLWQYTFGDKHTNDRFVDVEARGDYLYLAGRSERQSYVSLVNPAGEVGEANYMAQRLQGMRICDAGLLLFGSDDINAWAALMDDSGSLLWTYTDSGGTVEAPGEYLCAQEVPDGFLLGGYRGEDGIVMQLGPDGAPRWQASPAGAGITRVLDLATDGEYILLAGYYGLDGSLAVAVRLNARREVDFRIATYGSATGNRFSDVFVGDMGYLFCGAYGGAADGEKLSLFSVINRNRELMDSIQLPLGDVSEIVSLVPTPDGEVWAMGNTTADRGAAHQNVYLSQVARKWFTEAPATPTPKPGPTLLLPGASTPDGALSSCTARIHPTLPKMDFTVEPLEGSQPGLRLVVREHEAPQRVLQTIDFPTDSADALRGELMDFNLDGYADWVYHRKVGMTTEIYEVYLWDPADGQFYATNQSAVTAVNF